jgi:hypothetical protein
MEDFILVVGTFSPRVPAGCGSRAYTLPECLALEVFNKSSNECNERHSMLARNGTRIITMLIRARDGELIAHREWKPADPNQPELAL